jgi:hypothetical protein
LPGGHDASCAGVDHDRAFVDDQFLQRGSAASG